MWRGQITVPYRLCGLTPRASELFELLQLHKSLDIYPDRDQPAWRAFTQSRPY
ncbi:MAG: hypothetical protein MZV63_01055 [Marinilabiliales bacterium]|nr:hypothetical protein [Marinilabiliales bacterium]